MGKPLTIQEDDDRRIEDLKIRLGAPTKIAVVRAGLDLLERESRRLARIERWREASRAAAHQPRGQRRVSSALAPEAGMTFAPRRWHVYVVDLQPRVRTKPGKQRPCLVIQPTELAEAGLESTVVLPLTTRLTPTDAFPLRVRIPAGTAGIDRDSDLLVDQILAWDNSLFVRELGVIPDGLQEEVKAALRDFLDLF